MLFCSNYAIMLFISDVRYNISPTAKIPNVLHDSSCERSCPLRYGRTSQPASNDLFGLDWLVPPGSGTNPFASRVGGSGTFDNSLSESSFTCSTLATTVAARTFTKGASNGIRKQGPHRRPRGPQRPARAAVRSRGRPPGHLRARARRHLR